MVHIPNPLIKQNWKCSSCKFTSIVRLRAGQEQSHCPHCGKPTKKIR